MLLPCRLNGDTLFTTCINKSFYYAMKVMKCVMATNHWSGIIIYIYIYIYIYICYDTCMFTKVSYLKVCFLLEKVVRVGECTQFL